MDTGLLTRRRGSVVGSAEPGPEVCPPLHFTYWSSHVLLNTSHVPQSRQSLNGVLWVEQGKQFIKYNYCEGLVGAVIRGVLEAVGGPWVDLA